MPADVAGRLARMLLAGHLLGGQVQHRFHRRPPRDLNQLVDRQRRILDEPH
jgi:hypothetical protein